jgi:hypothetical protein
MSKSLPDPSLYRLLDLKHIGGRIWAYGKTTDFTDHTNLSDGGGMLRGAGRGRKRRKRAYENANEP